MCPTNDFFFFLHSYSAKIFDRIHKYLNVNLIKRKEAEKFRYLAFNNY